ncbi:MAG: Ig-like domain-containing protein [Bacteroidota bacterium]
MLRLLPALLLLLLATACDDTPVDPPDTTPPTVEITEPSANTEVSGEITVRYSVDEGNVTAVLLVDGATASTSTSGSFLLDTTTLADGLHTLQVEATDEAGNSSRSPTISIAVNNDQTGPDVILLAPGNGATLSGTFTVRYTAMDPTPPITATLLIDGTEAGTSRDGEIEFDTTTFADGAYSLVVEARDGNGNTSATPAIQITIDN